MGVVELRQYLSLFASRVAAEPVEVGRGQNPLSSEPQGVENSDILRQLVRLGGDFVAVLQRNGDVRDCSLSTDDFRGLTADDLRAGGFLQRIHILDRPAFLAALSCAVHDQRESSLEVRLRTPSIEGQPDYFCWIELACTANDTVVGDELGDQQILCLARDISRWKERERELVAENRSAHEMIDSKSRFLTTISHALRTPLNSIIGFSDMMKLPGLVAQDEQQMIEYASIINDSGRHLLGVVDEVLDMSQFEAGQYRLDPQIFRVADLVKAALELVQFEAEDKGIRFVVSAIDQDLQMNADWPACKQALVVYLAAQIKTAPTGKLQLDVMGLEGFVEFRLTGCQSYEEPSELGQLGGVQLQAFTELLSGSCNRGKTKLARSKQS